MSKLGRIVAIVCVLAGSAHAHFILNAPQSYDQQDTSGMPQKSAPCGQADAGYPVVATNAVTTVEAGSQLTIMIDEVIPHAGHYRVAIAPDMNSLPADPMTDSLCSTNTIENPPVLPVIADNMLPTTVAESGPHSFPVTIPASPGCTTCTLQVIEFMVNHGAPCYYHHCATVQVVPQGTGPDAGPNGNDAGGGGGGGTGAHHGGCSSTGGAGLGVALALLALCGRRRS